MKSHKYWSLGALFCMLGCIYSGIKKSMTCHGSGKTYQTGSKKRKKSICKIKRTAEETSSAVFY